MVRAPRSAQLGLGLLHAVAHAHALPPGRQVGLVLEDGPALRRRGEVVEHGGQMQVREADCAAREVLLIADDPIVDAHALGDLRQRRLDDGLVGLSTQYGPDQAMGDE